MEIQGKVISILAQEGGEGQNGPWKKQSFILETESKYPKKVCITMWGDRIDEFQLKQGETITASIEVESREFNSRWYTDIRAWRVEKEGNQERPNSDIPASVPPPADGNDDFPF